MGLVISVQLNKSTWERQRHTLSRPVEQAIQQRAAALRQFVDRDQDWVKWRERTGLALVINATVLDTLKPATLHPDPRVWSLDVSLSAKDYEGLIPGPEVTLRFIRTLEQVLVGVVSKVDSPPPTNLGVSKRESEWLEEGGRDPGPGARTPVRVRKPPGPMPEQRFWSVIAKTTDARSGAFRLGWEQADRFTARMRLLVAELDSPRHREAAESAIGFVSDDVWEDVRAWLVARGPDSFSQALVDPSTITAGLTALNSEDELPLGGRLLYLEGRD